MTFADVLERLWDANTIRNHMDLSKALDDAGRAWASFVKENQWIYGQGRMKALLRSTTNQPSHWSILQFDYNRSGKSTHNRKKNKHGRKGVRR